MLFFVTCICSKSRDLMISLEITCVGLCVGGHVSRTLMSQEVYFPETRLICIYNFQVFI